MPLEKLVVDERRAWGIWKMTEHEAEVSIALAGKETVPENMTHPQKRLEFLSGRLLASTLLREFDFDYHGLIKDQFGKPYIVGHDIHISLSHSFPYVAAIISCDGPVGIDLEQPKEKLLRIGPRVLSEDELTDAGNDITKHCVYWCAKETLIKIHGRKGLHLSTDLQISPFHRVEEGNIVGRLIVDGNTTVLPLRYRVTSEFVLVYHAGITKNEI